MPVYLLSKHVHLFPPPEQAEEDGLLAVGGDLCVPRLLNAYSNGIFPWYNPGEEIQWWCPKRRFVIFPEKIHISRSFRKMLKKTTMEAKINQDFATVIHACKTMRTGDTWITDDMEAAYKALHKAGYALSAEVYEKETLVGGLYGVAIGKCFFGESMFSKKTNASKLALIHLCQSLEGFLFIDCQFHTPHLESMGGCYLAWGEYKRLLRRGTGIFF